MRRLLLAEMALPRTRRQDPTARFDGILRFVPRTRRAWRRVATVAAAGMAANMAYNVVFGQNGLTSYEHKRAETKELATEQMRLSHENEFLRTHVDHLKSDPGAIEHQAREELHYTRPGEVIYTLPSEPRREAQHK